MRTHSSLISSSMTIACALLLAGCGSGEGAKSGDPASRIAALDISCERVGLGSAHPEHISFQDTLDRYVRQGFPGIAALVYTPEDGLWLGAAGYADQEARTPMQPCHQFFSGSVAKTYTITAALRLVEQGVLDLHEQIAPYLSEDVRENLPNAGLATVGQLMNHTAGMPDHDEEEGLETYILSHDGHLPPAEDQLAYLYDDEPRFPPGSSAEYSSAHTLTLSLVIDAAAKRYHADLISDEIIGKLGLKETFYKNEPGYPAPPRLVRGYLGAEDITRESINYCADSQGDAGIIASAHDYYLFLRGLMEGEALKAETVTRMIEQPASLYDDGNISFGFGLGLFVIGRDGDVVKIGHSGMTAGGMAHVYHYPATGSYIVLLTNILVEDGVDNLFDLFGPDLLGLWGQQHLVGIGEESIIADFEAMVLD